MKLLSFFQSVQWKKKNAELHEGKCRHSNLYRVGLGDSVGTIVAYGSDSGPPTRFLLHDFVIYRESEGGQSRLWQVWLWAARLLSALHA